MKKLFALSAVCVGALVLSGCIIPTKGTVQSALVLNHAASDPIVDNSVRPLKRGEAWSGGVLFFGSGDATIGEAMRNGGIRKVHHVDYHVKNIFWLYYEITNDVYRE